VSFVSPVHYNVSQVRVAASCPRIHFFDMQRARRTGKNLITRIWERGSASSTAGGSLFHATIEKLNKLAATDNEILAIVRNNSQRDGLLPALLGYLKRSCLNRPQFSKQSPEVMLNFNQCITTYLGELADILVYGHVQGKTAEEMVERLFADLPKRVDVTFHFGVGRSPVHVTGRLDYVFFDWRSARLRIIDYKLAPGTNPNNDLSQVVTYSLMYFHQHRYECDASVLYLHPNRLVVDRPWSEIQKDRPKVDSLLASMVEWGRYSEDKDTGKTTGLLPPGDLTYCGSCYWRIRCEQVLGPKSCGERVELTSLDVTLPPEVRTPLPPSSVELSAEEEVLEAERSEDLDEMLLEKDVVPEPTPQPVKSSGKSSKSAPALQPLPDETRSAVSQSLPANAPQSVATSPGSLWLGTFQHNQQPVTIAVPHLSTHTAIVGAAGSGKTWLAKVFAEEAIMNGVPVLAIDPQGDLVQFIQSADESEIPSELRPRFREFRARVEPRIFSPGTSHAIKLSLSPIRLPNRQAIMASSEERREEEYSLLLDAVAVNLVGLVSAGKKSLEQQQTFVGRLLRQSLELRPRDSLELSEVAAAIHAPSDFGIDDADLLIKKAERENLARQINALAYGPMKKLFSGGLTVDIDRLRTPVTPGRIPLNIIYLNALTDTEKHAFLAALATEVYRWMCCTGGSAERPQLLFYLDEARDYLPAGASKPPAKAPITRLFTQGRKYGVGCLICTQSPRSVDFNIFGNCGTKLIGRLETPQDSDRVAEWFKNDASPSDWIAQRTGAEKGTFVGRWPDLLPSAIGQLFTSRPLYSYHKGAWTPDHVESATADDDVHQHLRDCYKPG